MRLPLRSCGRNWARASFILNNVILLVELAKQGVFSIALCVHAKCLLCTSSRVAQFKAIDCNPFEMKRVCVTKAQHCLHITLHRLRLLGQRYSRIFGPFRKD